MQSSLEPHAASAAQRLAAELRPQHITVNGLRIESSVVTEGWTFFHPEDDYSGWGQPEVVATAIAWLATREPSFTGRILEVAKVRKSMGVANE